ncbi:hypothetical protein Nepgr_010372 [Nepenthes gracilis]|uniref:Uncharacterized protein n=1 Tax=Nepenthes gracilis TaxID=150966 RepID=A0AAD3XL04_NEPGR|nr:hypothetical protein Nepgr_010372 [Nepenthes gracilis]
MMLNQHSAGGLGSNRQPQKWSGDRGERERIFGTDDGHHCCAKHLGMKWMPGDALGIANASVRKPLRRLREMTLIIDASVVSLKWIRMLQIAMYKTQMQSPITEGSGIRKPTIT